VKSVVWKILKENQVGVLTLSSDGRCALIASASRSSLVRSRRLVSGVVRHHGVDEVVDEGRHELREGRK
jgi:hypothetical protein